MATRVTVTLEDDLDGGPAEETLRFGFGDVEYEIDLNNQNAVAFRELLAPVRGFRCRTVTDGTATVQLDPDFAAIVDTSEYHVFLTSNDPVCLYVAAKDAASFQIRAAPGIGGVTDETAGTVTASCSYRVVARRVDVPGRRLEEIVLPPHGDSAPIGPSGSGAVDLPHCHRSHPFLRAPSRPTRSRRRCRPRPLCLRRCTP
jgi:hypothetical protein